MCNWFNARGITHQNLQIWPIARVQKGSKAREQIQIKLIQITLQIVEYHWPVDRVKLKLIKLTLQMVAHHWPVDRVSMDLTRDKVIQ